MDVEVDDCWFGDIFDEPVVIGDDTVVLNPLSVQSSKKSDCIVLREVSDASDKICEENNNDPSSDSDDSAVDKTFGLLPKCLPSYESPRPSCSKRWRPKSQNRKSLLDTYVSSERVRHINGLLSKITRESILNCVIRNHDMLASQLKLWDLLPPNERVEFSQEHSSPLKKTLIDDFFGTAKRGPNEDICTIDYKKSSFDKGRSNDPPGIFGSSKAKCNSASGKAQVFIDGGLVNDNGWKKEEPSKPSGNSKVSPSSESPEVKIVEVVKVKRTNHDPFLTARKQLVHSVNKSKANVKDLVAPKIRFPASTTMIKNSTVPASTNEQHRVMNIPKIRILEQTSNSQQTSSSVAKKCQTQTQISVQGSRVKNEPPCDTKKDVRLTSSNDRQPNNDQIQGEMRQSTTRPVCMEMYSRLSHMFPNVNPNYIRKICPPEWGPGDRDAQLIPLVDHLLSQPNLPTITVKTDFKNDDDEACYDVDRMYETLLGIFPDADPHYLRETAEKVVGKSNSLREFIEDKLQSHDYPTREQYITKLKITEQQRQYTIGFDVKQFLTVIPDPFKHFMDPNRKCTHNTVAFEFLKSYFNKMRVHTISALYARSKYNISITADNLTKMTSDLKSKRMSYEIPTENIVVLQEIAFIKHKQQLSDHMMMEKTLEEYEFRRLKEENGLVECQCCFDSECIPSKCSNCENGHRFCNTCVKTGTSSKMGDGETRIACFLNCGSEFSISTLQKVLPPTTFSVLLKKRQAAEVLEAGLEGLIFCPFCDFASIPPEEDKVFKCLNPECMKESCRLCKELSHVPLKCDEVLKADKARHYIEEKMTQALARNCYKCRRAFVKEDGCNKITCPCGASMCYLCDQPIGKDYKHFRGQGADEKKLCPLYSDTARLDAVAVHKVAQVAQAELMKINPNINIDTTKLLPSIPRPAPGAHSTIANADELPLRLQRVRYELQ